MKPIAENTYDFEDLRKSGAVYVDKTGMLRDLIAHPGRKFYFIARPRRFGKSLMISTLRCIFEGRRDLFEGLEIAKTEEGKAGYDWKKRSVLQFDFSGVKTGSIEEFKEDFAAKVAEVIRKAGLKYDKKAFPGRNFANAIQTLRQKSDDGIVLLIDEYDAPIEHTIDKYELANAIREELSNFYIQIKENESCVRFMMMTGVTQFAKMSVFSALSNLTDISLDFEAATLLGYTKKELHTYFDEHMRAHAAVMGLGLDDYMERLRERCDGYLFSGKAKMEGETFNTPEEKQKAREAKLKAVKVYNPVAVGMNLAKRNEVFESSWVGTGRAAVMMNYISKHALASMDYESIPNIREDKLNSCSLEFLPAVTMLYQSGYLTIKGYSVERDRYALGVPNEEVREDLARLIVYSQKGEVALDQIRAKDYTLPYQVGEIPLYAIGLAFDSKTRNVKDMQVVRVR